MIHKVKVTDWLCVANSIASKMRISTESTCSAGYYGTTTCTLCPAGTYGSTTGLTSSSCSGNCNAGYYCIAGSTSPTQAICSTGTYSLAGAGSCTSCPAGTYGATTGLTSSSCSGNCNAGYYCIAGSTSPTQAICSAGTYSLAGAGSCTYCPVGTYGATTGLTSSSCSGNCNAGYFCFLGSTSSTTTACPAGTYSLAGAGSCTSCPAGTYSSSSASSSCDLCSAGRYGSVQGLTVSTCSGPCQLGYFCNAGSTNATAQACSKGTYSTGGASSCTNCPAGYVGYTRALTSSTCSGQCSAGYYCPTGSSYQIACASGYTSVAGASTCFPMPTSQPSGVPSRQPSSQPSSRPSQPSGQPSGQPSTRPTVQPSRQPSRCPTSIPTEQPRGDPSAEPTSQPSMIPTKQPSNRPSVQPTSSPSSLPSVNPSSHPSNQPSWQPISHPSSQPSASPVSSPSEQPSGKPSSQPTLAPSSGPSGKPTSSPTIVPSQQPSRNPTSLPTCQPSDQPSDLPSSYPSCQPTVVPSMRPTCAPSAIPSSRPSRQPSMQPTGLPSLNPTMRPSTEPSTLPSGQPSSTPTIQPASRPSSQPSSQPSRKPSHQPSSKPSTQPFGRPTRQPSVRPSTQPTSLPSLQPQSRPSSSPSVSPTNYPSSRPSGFPSARPSSQPTQVPSIQPSAQPSSFPSIQPTSSPSIQPSQKPSGFPSASPSLFPTATPTSSPTINGSACEINTYYHEPNNTCLPCVLHSSSLIGSVTCACNRGYSSRGFGVSLQCAPCPVGTYELNSVCIGVPRGAFVASEGSTAFQLCPHGYYQSNSNQSACIPCGGGKGTAQLGAVSANECVSPVPNFTIGTVSLSFVAVLFVWYIFLGRFHRVAFERRQKIVLPISHASVKITEELKASRRQNNRLINNLNSKVKVALFVGVSGIICFFVSALLYTAITYQMFFSALIMWRGFGFSLDMSIIENRLESAIRSVALLIGMPSMSLYILVYPFLMLLHLITSIDLNLDSVSVTCQGAQAPIQLLIGCIILGVVVIFIRCDYQLLFNVTFPNLNQAYLTNCIEQGRLWCNFNVIFCLLAMVLTSINPFQMVLRYLMGIIEFGKFSENRGVFHAVSPSCDNIPGLPYYDSILGYFSSVVVWCLLLPTIYIIADVVVPRTVSQKVGILNDRLKIEGGDSLVTEAEFVREAENVDAYVQDLLKHVSPDLRNNLTNTISSKEFQSTRQKSLKVPKRISGTKRTIELMRKTVLSRSGHSRYVARYTVESSTYVISTDLWLMYIAEAWILRLSKEQESISTNGKETKEKMRRKRIHPTKSNSTSRFSLRSTKLVLESFESKKNQWKEGLESYSSKKDKIDTELTLLWKATENSNLPTYYNLCLKVRSDLHQCFKDNLGINDVDMFAVLLAFSGVGHVFTSYGRSCWLMVLNKYRLFFLVCLGIWTEEAFVAYDLKSIAGIVSTEGINEVILKVIGSVVSSRAILFQALPMMSVLSVVVMAFSASPLFVMSPTLNSILPGMIIWNSFEVALEREIEVTKLTKRDLVDYAWHIHLRAVMIFVLESRILQTINSFLQLIVSFLLLFYSERVIVGVGLCLLLLSPFILVRSFVCLIYFGKSLDLRDSDLKSVFPIKMNEIHPDNQIHTNEIEPGVEEVRRSNVEGVDAERGYLSSVDQESIMTSRAAEAMETIQKDSLSESSFENFVVPEYDSDGSNAESGVIPEVKSEGSDDEDFNSLSDDDLSWG